MTTTTSTRPVNVPSDILRDDERFALSGIVDFSSRWEMVNRGNPHLCGEAA